MSEEQVHIDPAEEIYKRIETEADAAAEMAPFDELALIVNQVLEQVEGVDTGVLDEREISVIAYRQAIYWKTYADLWEVFHKVGGHIAHVIGLRVAEKYAKRNSDVTAERMEFWRIEKEVSVGIMEAVRRAAGDNVFEMEQTKVA